MGETKVSSDGKSRCRWCYAVAEFLACHDTGCSFQVSDDGRLFEKLNLENFQSGWGAYGYSR